MFGGGNKDFINWLKMYRTLAEVITKRSFPELNRNYEATQVMQP